MKNVARVTAMSIVLAAMVSCATVHEQYAEAMDIRDYDKALALAENVKGPEQAKYFTELAVKYTILPIEKRTDLLVRANTEEARKILAKLGEEYIRSNLYEAGEKILREGGLSQEKIDAMVGSSASKKAGKDLAQLHERYDDMEFMTVSTKTETLRKNFESTRALAFERLRRAGNQGEYLKSVADLLGGDLRIEEAEKIIAESTIDEAKKKEFTTRTCLSAAAASHMKAVTSAAELRLFTVNNVPLKAEKTKVTLDKRLSDAVSYARKAFESAVSFGDKKIIEAAAVTLVDSALDSHLGDKVDLDSVRRVHAYYRKSDSKDWIKTVPVAIARGGAYDEAETCFKEAGIPASEYCPILVKAAEERKDPPTIVAKYLVRSGDRDSMEKEATGFLYDAKKISKTLWKLSGETYKGKKAEFLAGTDAVAALAAALGKKPLFDECIDLVFPFGEYERMVSYSRGFGIDERTAYVSIAARCEKFERFIEAAEYYEKLNDRPNLSRVADTLYTRSKASYERSVKEMNFHLKLWEGAYQSGLSSPAYKSNFEKARNNFFISRERGIKETEKACTLYWSLGNKEKAFVALEFLAQIGGLEESKKFQAKWLVADRLLLEKIEKAAEKARETEKTAEPALR